MNLLSLLNQLMQYDSVDKNTLARLELAVETDNRNEILEILGKMKYGANVPTIIVGLIEELIDTLKGRK